MSLMVLQQQWHVLVLLLPVHTIRLLPSALLMLALIFLQVDALQYELQ